MLNEAQSRAVEVHGHCLITACPGSGKTTVLEHRAAHLLKKPGVTIIGVTFSSESAKELERRVKSRSPEAAKRTLFGTFHGLCKKQLEAGGQKFRLVNELQQADLIRRAYMDALDFDELVDFDSCLAFIESVKSAVDPILPSPHVEPRVKVYERYEELLRQTGAYDFADLLRLAVRGMRTPPGMKGHVAPFKATHLLVDEWQDTDPVQYDWVKEHITHGATVTVVGDDDQSIYSWRGAGGAKAMTDFRYLTQATHVSLDTTYRYPREIMKPAAQLIVNNIERIPKALTTANLGKGVVEVVRCSSKDDQHAKIWTAVLESGEPGNWVVLARTNSQLEALETSLPESLTCIRIGGRSFWEMQAPALYLSLVRSIAANEMHSLDIVLKAAGMTEEGLAKLHEECRSAQPGAIGRFLDQKKQGSIAAPDERLRAQMKQWRSMIGAGDINLVLRGMSHYLKSYARLGSKDRSQSQVGRDNMRFDAAAAILCRLRGALHSRLHTLMQSESEREGAVKLMTMHASKGLEFKHVWVMGCEDGVIPSQKGLLDEERRLFYVAMTRAKHRLSVSYVIGENSKPSPFLFESGLFALAGR